MKIRKLILIALIISSFELLAQTGTSGRSIHGSEWGLPVNGLQMSISEGQSNDASIPRFQLQFRNDGKRDLILNLGRMLGNGRIQLPDRVFLELTDASGKMRKLKFFHTMFVAGRVDDYVIPLRVGSTYALTITLDQFYSPDTKEYAVRLPAGTTKVVAFLDGVGAMNVNSDTPGIGLMEFWTGNVQSNSLAVRR